MSLIHRIWPIRFGEDRQLVSPDGESSALNSYLAGLDSFFTDGGPVPDPAQTAAVEFAVGMVARAFMVARVVPAVPALSPLTLSMIAEQTVLLGNAVFVVGRQGLDLSLEPVAGYSISGGTRPELWRYEINRRRPMGEDEDGDGITAILPYEGVVHVRYKPKRVAPWQGRSPLENAGLTATQLAFIERSMRYDAEPRPGYGIPVPDGVSTRVITSLKNLMTGHGGVSLAQTMSQGWGQGQSSAPKDDYKQFRFGGEVPEANIQLRESSAMAVMSALGIPPSLYSSEGSALRESYRNFFTSTIEPLGALIAAELSEKLETAIDITFPQAFKSDMSARSRALPSLIQAGVPARAAGRLIGLPEDALPVESDEEPEIDG